MQTIYLVIWFSSDLFDPIVNKTVLAAYDTEDAAQKAVKAFNDTSPNTNYSWAEYQNMEVQSGK